MKKALLIGILLCAAAFAHAQQFWIENWTGSTAQGQLTYTGPNGAWTVQQTGSNGADSNAWYFSNLEEAKGRGMCGDSGGHATAHMGNTANAPLLGLAGADNGAVIDDFSSGGTNTNLRLQSPVINCIGKTNITLSFNYIEGNSAGNDFITIDYFNGSTWSTLSTPAELDSCSNQQGLWTYYSVALPASANNNTNVRIGFNWTNNTASFDDNDLLNNSVEIVSFAVDSVVLSTPVVNSVNEADANNKLTVYPNPVAGMVNIDAGKLAGNIQNISVYDLSGKLLETNTHPDVKGSVISFNMSGYACDLYIIRVTTTQGNYFQKVSKL